MPISPRSIRGISFDYGHVLAGLDLHELRSRLVHRGERVTVDALRNSMPAAYHAHDVAIAQGLGHEQGWRALVGTLLRGGGIVDDVDREIDALWQAQPTRNLWRDVPDEARALLARLSHAKVPMVITSNSEGRVAELLAEVGLAHHFPTILDSGRLGFGKPERRIFELAAEKLGVALESMVHIGDSEAADVIGARRAGAKAIRFDGFVPGASSRPTEADAHASTFPELSRLLEAALVVPLAGRTEVP